MRPPKEALRAVAEVLGSGWLSAGPAVESCERSLAEMFGREHAVLTGSAASALHLALICSAVPPGREVVVSALSSVNVAVAVRDAGGRRVTADVASPLSPEVWSAAAEGRIGPHTGAVVVSHFAGYMADARRLVDACAAHGVPLIQDAFEGTLAAEVGGSAAVAFGPDSPLPTLPAGAFLCDVPEVAEQARRLRSHGMTSSTWSRHTGKTSSYDVRELGYSYRPDEARAAFIQGCCVNWPAAIERRRLLTRRYRQALSEVPGVSVPFVTDDVGRAACSRMVVLLDDRESSGRVRCRMLRGGVATARLAVAPGDAPVAADLAGRALVLPLAAEMDEGDVDRVISALVQAVCS